MIQFRGRQSTLVQAILAFWLRREMPVGTPGPAGCEGSLVCGRDEMRIVPRLAVVTMLAVAAAPAAWSQGVPSAAPPPAAGFPAFSKTPPVPVPVDAALAKAAEDLVKQLPPGDQPIEIVVDPLIDGITGGQTNATRRIGQQFGELLTRASGRIKIIPFTRQNATRARFVLIGTFNTINNAGQPSAQRDAYWMCFSLVDTEKKVVAARAVGRVLPTLIDSTPVGLSAAAPVWALDKATRAYIAACQRAKPGDTISPDYADRVGLDAALSEAEAAFEARRFDEALRLFQEADSLSQGEPKIAVLNGLYLTQMQAGRKADAMGTFARLIDAGIRDQRLGVIMLFKPGSPGFVRDPEVSGVYPEWLDVIAKRTRAANVCLDVVGHASRTGPERINVMVTRGRAHAVRQQLLRGAPDLARNVSATGVGSREVLVGLPVDDAQTAVDRRVEFRPHVCAAPKKPSRRASIDGVDGAS